MFVNRIKKRLWNKKGMTLLEVIVASAVSSIILICALGLFMPLNNSITSNQNIADAKVVSANIIFAIEQKVQYAKSVTILKDVPSYPTGLTNKAIYQKSSGSPNNIIKTMYTSTGADADGVDIIGEGFYGKLDYKVYYKQAIDTTTTPVTRKPALEVNVKVYKKGTSVLIYDTTNTIRVLNATLNSITDNTTPPPSGEYHYITFQ